MGRIITSGLTSPAPTIVLALMEETALMELAMSTRECAIVPKVMETFSATNQDSNSFGSSSS